MTGEINGNLATRAAGHASQDGINRPATIGVTVHIPPDGAGCPTARGAAAPPPLSKAAPARLSEVAPAPPGGTICASGKSAAAPPPPSGAGHPASLNRATNPPAGDKAVQEKLRLSADEVEDLTERDVRCPYCGFLVTRVFPDAAGHLGVSCRKCKRQMVLNLAYFRRRKRRSPPVLPGFGGLPGERGRGRGGTKYARR